MIWNEFDIITVKYLKSFIFVFYFWSSESKFVFFIETAIIFVEQCLVNSECIVCFWIEKSFQNMYFSSVFWFTVKSKSTIYPFEFFWIHFSI